VTLRVIYCVSVLLVLENTFRGPLAPGYYDITFLRANSQLPSMSKKSSTDALIPLDEIQPMVRIVRGQRVMLDFDLPWRII